MGAAYVFGFQPYKEPGLGETVTERSSRWSCMDSASPGHFVTRASGSATSLENI